MSRKWFAQHDKLDAAAPEPILLGLVAADGSRCVQCGVCGYNCPVGIDVRSYARRGATVTDAACLTCGNCIDVCPRGTLRWERALPPDGTETG
jgi:ferredoxin